MPSDPQMLPPSPISIPIPISISTRRVALVHDWLVAHRGGEAVLLELARLFPGAPIYTLVHEPSRTHPELLQHPIHTSFIQRLPGAPRRFRTFLPLFPRAIEAFDLRGFDLIVSTSHCVAKGVMTRPGQRHICYVHTPMRYLWDQLLQYLPAGVAGRLLEPLVRFASQPLRRWDQRSARRPDDLIANSAYVAARIERVWGRRARVIHPPVDTDFFAASASAPAAPRDGFVVAGALVPYKRAELAVRLATARALPLTVVGDGPEGPRLRALAGPTVRFVCDLERAALRALYASSVALLYCGAEDFGIIPVEAMAAGCPVIALGQGGLLETIVGEGPEATGVFFDEPTVASLAAALQRFEAARRRGAFQPEVLRARARLFDRACFVDRMRRVIDDRPV